LKKPKNFVDFDASIHTYEHTLRKSNYWRAMRTEQKFWQKREKYIEADEVVEQRKNISKIMHDELLKIPDDLSEVLAGIDDSSAVAALLDERFRHALANIAMLLQKEEEKN